MLKLAAIILTHNEEIHLDRALRHVKKLTNDVFVIDSFSTDATLEIARTHDATVYQHQFVNYAKQFQWALDHIPITADWILRLDADEIIEDDLVQEIQDVLPKVSEEITGINLKRKLIFLNQPIRYGGRGILILLRIWRRGFGRIEDRWMDEHIVLQSGKTITLGGGFVDHNLNDLTFFTDKHNKYATREAIDVLNQRLDFMPRPEIFSARQSSFQAAVKRFVKENLYNSIPFQFSAACYFLYRYILRVGFLDGKVGIIYHVLQGFWYRFLVGAKVEELQKAVENLSDKRAIRAEITRLTRFNLDASQEKSQG